MSENSLICKIPHKLIYKKLFALGLTIFLIYMKKYCLPGRAGSISHKSTITGVWPVWGSSFSSTSAVFSFSVLVQMHGWQEKKGAS